MSRTQTQRTVRRLCYNTILDYQQSENLKLLGNGPNHVHQDKALQITKNIKQMYSKNSKTLISGQPIMILQHNTYQVTEQVKKHILQRWITP